MKSFCIKNNNNLILDYLLAELKTINLHLESRAEFNSNDGFSVVATDFTGMVVQGLESNKNG